MARQLERVAMYRDIPIWWNGGRYVAFLTLNGSNVYIPGGGFHTVAAAKKFVGRAINMGAVGSAMLRTNPALPKLKTTQVPGVRYGFPPARAGGLRNPRRLEVVAVYKGVPIFFDGGGYVVDMVRGGGGVSTPRTSTLAAMKRTVGYALNQGATARHPELKRGTVLQNPALTVVRNPSRSRDGQVLTDRVLAIQYIHNADGKAYEHKFKRGVTVEFLPDGSARLYRKDGRPLWKDVV